MIKGTNDNPTLSEALDYYVSQRLAAVNTGIPGTIVKYDDKKGLAEVQINVRQLFSDGVQVEIPPLYNVPVEQYRSSAGNAYLSIPIKAGDTGWVKFSQRTIDKWIKNGTTQDMTSLQMFDLSDGVFFPGLYPTSNPIRSGDTSKVVLRNYDTSVSLDTDDVKVLSKSGGKLSITGDKIGVGNNAGDVLELFNDLLSQLLISFGVSPTGPAPLDPASKLEISRIQALLALIKGG